MFTCFCSIIQGIYFIKKFVLLPPKYFLCPVLAAFLAYTTHTLCMHSATCWSLWCRPNWQITYAGHPTLCCAPWLFEIWHCTLVSLNKCRGQILADLSKRALLLATGHVAPPLHCPWKGGGKSKQRHMQAPHSSCWLHAMHSQTHTDHNPSQTTTPWSPLITPQRANHLL